MADEEIKIKAINEGKAFAEAITNPDLELSLYLKMARHYDEEMRKAVEHGRICTAERMAILYPIFLEINLEMEEINDYWANVAKKHKVKESKKNKSEVCDG